MDQHYVGTHRDRGDFRGELINTLWDPKFVTILPMLGLMALGFVVTAVIYWTVPIGN